MANFDVAELAVKATAPSNEILYDDKGYPSIMVFIPKFKLSEVIAGGADEYHPAFRINDTIVDGIYISKYQNVLNNGRAYSLPGKDPAVNINWDNARAACEAKGAGWHMMTKAEWGMIALWCKKNGFMPYGNNNYGKDSRETLQAAIPANYGSDGKINRVLTGTGPLTWSHNKQQDGIWDLNGNVSEWEGGYRTVKGELQFLPYNNAADKSHSQTAASSEWKALDATTGQFITPDGSGTTPNSVKVDKAGSGGAQYCTAITTRSSDFNCLMGAFTCTADISDAAKAVLRAYALLQENGTTTADYDGDRLYFNNEADERVAYGGGVYGYTTNAGVFFSGGSGSTRTSTSTYIGFRSAYAPLPTA